MGRCKMDDLLNKVGINKMGKEVEVDFHVHKNLESCRHINTRNIVSASEGYSYNKNRKPQNHFECLREGCVKHGCVNSGTLLMGAANDTALFKAQFDGTEFAAGAVTFYVYVPEGTTAPIEVTFKIGETQALTNADVYTHTITASEIKADGFAPILIDLSQTPSSTAGNGWTPGPINFIQLSADKAVGYSSISIYDSLQDFLIDNVVKVGCLTSVGGTFDVPAIEATCLAAGQDDSITSLTYTVEGTTVSPNYWMLNPLMGEGTEVEGFRINTVKKTVEATTGYGQVILSDAFQDECGFIAVEAAESCDVTDSYLKQLSVPTRVSLTEDQYQVIKNADGTTTLLFNQNMVGVDVLISYPQTVAIEEEVASAENIGGVYTRMSVPWAYSDGTEYVFIFDNVLITSFPAAINSNSEATFSFSISIQRDENGVFFRKRRIVA